MRSSRTRGVRNVRVNEGKRIRRPLLLVTFVGLCNALFLAVVAHQTVNFRHRQTARRHISARFGGAEVLYCQTKSRLTQDGARLLLGHVSYKHAGCQDELSRHAGPTMGSEGSQHDSRASNAARFTTTHWSVVLAAGDSVSARGSQALEILCRTYWYPLYAYVRSSGHSSADAQDLTQEFFARLIAKQYLSAVHQERGKFRWFLLTAIKRFLINERERASATKRGGLMVHIPFDGEKAEERYRLDAADLRTPDKLFDRAWAMDLIQRTYQRLQEENTLEGREKLFERLQVYLAGDKAELTYADAGAQLGMSEGAVKVAVHRLRRRYRELLREEVLQTVHSVADLEEELGSLRAMFSG